MLRDGTAISLFYRDMPRLSVDIDFTYLPVEIVMRHLPVSTRRSIASARTFCETSEA
ncbi:Nucleotidyl transferase AbiEii toxin, Type IV TA system [Bosea lupini]|uniref:Nucleotidyl transferase AbiEii toxin, Type IV TA system n=1 Tax=Bosea lupini TaxID=1036779 RepID=A0A1H7ZPA5_9HYPH|nr:Nucleotidyl transferase AbiEii toxin, Type IV TA system [Bosea lupini]